MRQVSNPHPPFGRPLPEGEVGAFRELVSNAILEVVAPTTSRNALLKLTEPVLDNSEPAVC
jgi:hypothetical protein